MTKIARIIAVDFGKYLLGYTRKKKTTVINEGTELIDVATIISSNPVFSGVFVGKIQPKYPASSTIYFRENYVLQNESGEFAITDHGFGKAGTTDADGKFTPNYALPALSLTAPSAGTKYKLSESFNVTWTSSNITLVNVILESESGGYKKYSDVDATLGTLAVAISASDGFSINETVYIYIENTHQTVEDSVQVASIATMVVNTISEGNLTSYFVYNGKAYASGSGVNYARGDGATAAVRKPTKVADDASSSLNNKTVVSVTGGYYYNGFAIDSDGGLHGWGKNGQYQLGTGNTTDAQKPIAINNGSLSGKKVIGISAGGSTGNVLAWCDDGTLHGWGKNAEGAVGDGTKNAITTPKQINSAVFGTEGKKVVHASAGMANSCVVCEDGTLYCCGDNNNGSVGDNTTTERLEFVLINGGTLSGKTVIKATASSGEFFCVALCDDGTLHSWGNNKYDTYYYGLLGISGTTVSRKAPGLVDMSTSSLAGKTVIDLASNFGLVVLVIDSDGVVHGWGDASAYYHIGDGSNARRQTAVLVATDTTLSGKTIVQVTSGERSSHALDSEGVVHGWGDGINGSVGDGTNTTRSKPVLVDTSGVT